MLKEVYHTESTKIISIIHCGQSFQTPCKHLVGTVKSLKVLNLIDSNKTEEITRKKKDDIEEAFAA